MVLSIMTLTLFACTPQTDEDSTVLIPDTNDESFVDELLEQLSLEAKVGQMLQAERQNITPEEVKDYNIGSLLSGGGSHPESPSDGVDTWYDMVKGYQDSATASSSGIPLIYGVDAVHGHNNVYGATIFPHNINLDMANDADLMGRIGEITATEMKTTGVHWNFSPAVSVVKDIRWGRSYEGFSEDNSIHANLVSSYIEGLQSHDVIATAKHFVADGGTDSGVDQGDVLLSEDAIRDILLPPFEDAGKPVWIL
jgi:beta-glucosidase